jgi:hypothetical protein
MKRRINAAVLQALKNLGYYRWQLKGDSVHAHRSSSHLIVKLSKSGKLKQVQAHKDKTIMIGAIGLHKTIYDESSREAAKEFREEYRRVVKRGVRKSVAQLS